MWRMGVEDAQAFEAGHDYVVFKMKDGASSIMRKMFVGRA